MKFIDLFAGLGGFHVGLTNLGHECVFACELDEGLQDIYEKNHGIRPAGDLRQVKNADIPAHDILCAGFPCQPFSKAGAQDGFGCSRNGTLFDEVARIVEYRRPEFVILENVPNLKKHNDGKTWQLIYERLQELGYKTDADLYSPHEFGIPQIRQRILIVARKKSLGDFTWPDRPENAKPQLTSILDKKPKDAKQLSAQVTKCLDVWQEFLDLIPADEHLPSWPIWSMEFGATYPFEDTTPHAVGADGLREYRGCHGVKLNSKTFEDPFAGLPSHGRTPQELFPSWKRYFIRANRAFYQKHKARLVDWMPKIQEFPTSLQKFEWNCQGEPRDVWKLVIQFRASGVRVKRPDTSPSLVAMTTTQVPIIGWERRYMTARECSRLQSLDSLEHLPETETRAFKALGNAVNAKLVEFIAGRLIPTEGKPLPTKASAKVLPSSQPDLKTLPSHAIRYR
jgi:DNA (cytosine-5)-methyltransferase 1